jgi:hypothetical protein
MASSRILFSGSPNALNDHAKWCKPLLFDYARQTEFNAVCGFQGLNGDGRLLRTCAANFSASSGKARVVSGGNKTKPPEDVGPKSLRESGMTKRNPAEPFFVSYRPSSPHGDS